ncbi:reverse transcriptase domain-containing protein [Tanacetum coccineum]
MRFSLDTPSTSIKLNICIFHYNPLLEFIPNLLEKEPPRSILTWDDLVSKFINQFFPPSKTTNLRNEITRFQQRFDESFYEAWDRFNDLLRACQQHGFQTTSTDTCLVNAKIIESKSKVCNSRNKAIVAKVSSNSSTPGISPDDSALTLQPNQPPVYQAQPYQAPAPQMQGVSKTDFENYVKANDAILRNMQNQGQGSLPSNTVTNPKEDLKVDAPVSAPMPNPKPSIPYPSRRNDEKRRENADEQKEKFPERIFKDIVSKLVSRHN